MSKLILKNISKEFENVVLLKNINFTFEFGNLYLIKAKSGLGKTTLLTILGQLEEPTNGEVLFNGFDSNKNLFSYFFTDYQCFLELTGRENLLLINRDVNQILSLSKKLGIEKILDKPMIQYSKGEVQRLVLMRVLLENKPIILLDEPTGNLDEQNTKLVFELLKEYSKTKLIICVTHDYSNDEITTLTINNKSIQVENMVKVNYKDFVSSIEKRTLNIKFIFKFINNIYHKLPIKLIIFIGMSIIISFFSFISSSLMNPNQCINELLTDNELKYIKSSSNYNFSYQLFSYELEFDTLECLYSNDNNFYIDGKKYTLKDNEIVLSNKIISPNLDLIVIDHIDLDINLISNNIVKKNLETKKINIEIKDIPLINELLLKEYLNIFDFNISKEKINFLGKNEILIYCSEKYYDSVKVILEPYYNTILKINNKAINKYTDTLVISNIIIDNNLDDLEMSISMSKAIWDIFVNDYFNFNAYIMNQTHPFVITNEFYDNIKYSSILLESNYLQEKVNFYIQLNIMFIAFKILTAFVYFVYTIFILFIVNAINRRFRYNKTLIRILGFKFNDIFIIYFATIIIPYLISNIIGFLFFIGNQDNISDIMIKFYNFNEVEKPFINFQFSPYIIIYVLVIVLIVLRYSLTNTNYIQEIKLNRE